MEEGSEYDLLEANLVPDCTVLKVAHHGHVLAHSDGKTMEFSASRNGSGVVVSRKELSASSSAQKNTSVQGDSTSTRKEAVTVTYILNTSSKKFHLPSCHPPAKSRKTTKRIFLEVAKKC